MWENFDHMVMQWAVISRVPPSVGSGHLWGRLMWLIDIKNSVEMMIMIIIMIIWKWSSWWWSSSWNDIADDDADGNDDDHHVEHDECDFVDFFTDNCDGSSFQLYCQHLQLMREKKEKGRSRCKKWPPPGRGICLERASLVSSSHKLSLLWKCAQCNCEIWALLCEVGLGRAGFCFPWENPRKENNI